MLRITCKKCQPAAANLINQQLRFSSELSVKKSVQDNNDNRPEVKIQAWQIHSYGGVDDLKLSNTRIPVISKPNELLIKVDASSVNPIDVAMSSTS